MEPEPSREIIHEERIQQTQYRLSLAITKQGFLRSTR